MKKIGALILALILALGCFAGAGASEPAAEADDEEFTVEVEGNGEGTGQAAGNAAFPNVPEANEMIFTQYLDPPENVTFTVSGKKLTISWDTVVTAQLYLLYEEVPAGSGNYVLIDTPTATSVTIKMPAKGKHRYCVMSGIWMTGNLHVSYYYRFRDIQVSAYRKNQYYALLIGEKTFGQMALIDGKLVPWSYEFATRNEYDVKNMAAMLSGVRGPKGQSWKITSKIDLGYDAIQKAIRTTFKKAKKTDVCLFFIATHGNSDGDGELAMPFTKPLSQLKAFQKSSKSSLPFSTLAGWLKKYCKGKVIVLIESCGAGSAVYGPGVKQNDPEEAMRAAGVEILENSMSAPEGAAEGELIANAPEAEDNGAAFVSRAVSAFAGADPGILEDDPEITGNKGAGAMRNPKFYVLAASRHHEVSYGTEVVGSQGNYFTKWLIEGVGNWQKSPADTNKNHVITLKEAFAYLKKHKKTPGGGVQHAQVYPQNSSFELFRLN